MKNIDIGKRTVVCNGRCLFWLASFLFVVSTLLVGCRPAGTNATDEIASGGAIQNKGSDTLVNIALAWAEAYQQVAPEVTVAVTGGGSGTGIASLINGTVDIANASRAMKDSEIEEARANGFDPIEHVVAIDALAVIVHLDNPVSELTIQQLADMYTGRVTNWQEVGGLDAPIVRETLKTRTFLPRKRCSCLPR